MHDLAARLARGDEAAFAELYDACADRLYRYLLCRVGSPEAAADVLQMTFLRVVKNRRRFRKVKNPVAYLFQIARNETARAWKGRRSEVSTLPIESLDSVAASTSRSEDDTETIRAALASLTADDRELVELKLYAGLTFREIAELSGLPPGTVATRYRRTMETLRDWLTRQLR